MEPEEFWGWRFEFMNLKSFLFVTHLTPTSKRSSLRSDLQKIYFKALNNQTFENWKVLLMGEKDEVNDKFIEIDVGNYQTKTERSQRLNAIYSRKEIIDLFYSSDFIVKMDDDDIISPTILSKVNSMHFDVYYDQYHHFYDVSSGIISRQKRNWIPSTCIHKREHAITKINPVGPDNIYSNSVLYSDHSKVWHVYYKSKNIVFSDIDSPVYLRVLSPTSISSGATHFPLTGFEQVNMMEYDNYLKKFGNWTTIKGNDFNAYLDDLKYSWEDFSGSSFRELNFKERSNLFQKIKSRIFNK